MEKKKKSAKTVKTTKTSKKGKKTTKTNKTTRAVKSTKTTKATKTTKTTKKELTAKDRKKVRGGYGLTIPIDTMKGAIADKYRPTFGMGHMVRVKKFASAKDAEQYLVDMGYSRSKATYLAHALLAK